MKMIGSKKIIVLALVFIVAALFAPAMITAEEAPAPAAPALKIDTGDTA
jgi:hypothetical protein